MFWPLNLPSSGYLFEKKNKIIIKLCMKYIMHVARMGEERGGVWGLGGETGGKEATGET